MIKKAFCATLLCLAAIPASAQGSGRLAFDIDGGVCDNEIRAIFDPKGGVIVNTGSRYMGDGSFRPLSPNATRQGAGGLVIFDSVSVDDGRAVTWTVRADGYFTSSDGYDADTIAMEGAVDVTKLTPCE